MIVRLGGIFVALALISLFGSIIWLLIASDNNVRLGVLTAFVSVALFIASQFLIQKREAKSRLFEKKSEVYETFFTLLGENFAGHLNIGADRLNDDELAKRLFDIKIKMFVWASADSFKKFGRLDEIALARDEHAILDQMDDLIRSLRADLGHDDSELVKGDCAGVFLIAEDRKKYLAGQKFS